MALLLMPRVTSSSISLCRGVRALLDPVRLAFNEFVAAGLVECVQNMNELPRCLGTRDTSPPRVYVNADLNRSVWSPANAVAHCVNGRFLVNTMEPRSLRLATTLKNRFASSGPKGK